LYFVAFTPDTGRDLFFLSTSLSVSAVDIAKGPAGSRPYGFASINGKLYLGATTNKTGTELVIASNSKATIVDIVPGAGSSYPDYFAASPNAKENLVYFSAYTPATGFELFKSDGSSKGTTVAIDLVAGAGSSDVSYVTSVPSIGRLVFQAYDQNRNSLLWASNGTLAGSALTSGYDMIEGTSTGSFYVNDGTLFFSAYTATSGQELRAVSSLDVNGAPVVRTFDVQQGAGSSLLPGGFAPVTLDSTAFALPLRTRPLGEEPYIYRSINGTGSPVLIADVFAKTGGTSGSSYPAQQTQFYNYNGRILYNAIGAAGDEPYQSFLVEKKATGNTYHAKFTQPTRMINNVNPGRSGSFPAEFTAYESYLVFSAYSPRYGRELFYVDYSDQTNKQNRIPVELEVADINTGTAGSDPSGFVVFGDELYFTAFTAATGYEIFSFNKKAQFGLVADILQGAGSSTPYGLTPYKGYLYFGAYSVAAGDELWRTNGATDLAGTSLFWDIFPGAGSSFPTTYAVLDTLGLGPILFFVATDGKTGFELYLSDGLSVKLAWDIYPGAGDSNPVSLTPYKNLIYFTARDPVYGNELRVASTVGQDFLAGLVKDIAPGAGDSNPGFITPYRDGFFFTATTSVNGTELWQSFGVESETFQFGDFAQGAVSSTPTELTVVGDKLYFAAAATFNNRELWSVSPSNFDLILTQETELNGVAGSNPNTLSSLAGSIIFSAYDAKTGYEPYARIKN